MELFDLPDAPVERLDAATHRAVFGDLPSILAASLHTPEVGDLVVQLSDRGWRLGQVASRVGALPVGRDQVAEVTALLRTLVEEVPPDARWRQERSQRAAERAAADREATPASDASREQWISRIRTELGAPRPRTREPVRRLRPPCALCGAESSYFVTREVRLCEGCVVLLGTGAVRLSDAG